MLCAAPSGALHFGQDIRFTKHSAPTEPLRYRSLLEAAFGPWHSTRHSELTLPFLQKALQELPNHKRNRKIFFVNGWLGAFIGGQRSEEALGIINKFLADNPKLDNDRRLKILENADIIERAVKIRSKFVPR